MLGQGKNCTAWKGREVVTLAEKRGKIGKIIF